MFHYSVTCEDKTDRSIMQFAVIAVYLLRYNYIDPNDRRKYMYFKLSNCNSVKIDALFLFLG